ncbi:hypothetical protein K7462_00315 [Pseudomonas fluorescens]|uniref:hypothetical protein n=1 Tax=Pseudomonas fluorescens TaxID=294 RepID=UPI00003C75B1|nr:hypothetical protein [Pseudomonas fluorescens]MBY9033807.1 hypothetical protein [Pseudomonas fluorescens]MBY9040284.1 hypothetical protein [Pseudomonas fluorescens]MBY9045707.1 hypothetical protein [Pseudomonas fluorescens]
MTIQEVGKQVVPTARASIAIDAFYHVLYRMLVSLVDNARKFGNQVTINVVLNSTPAC